MLDRYLEAGELWVWEEDGVCLAVAVVLGLDDTRCELKNLAVAIEKQGQGIGSACVRELAAYYSQRYQTMLVGTSDDGVAFYERLGFVEDCVERGFFTTHYVQPIYENGHLCVDMIYLKRTLTGEGV